MWLCLASSSLAIRIINQLLSGWQVREGNGDRFSPKRVSSGWSISEACDSSPNSSPIQGGAFRLTLAACKSLSFSLALKGRVRERWEL
ncbi:MAG TPA: hypothetical protein V6D43_12095 [Candidatus Sericytochromatia bacterium]